MTRSGAHSYWVPGSIIRSDYGKVLIKDPLRNCMGILTAAHAAAISVCRHNLANHVHLSATEIQEKDSSDQPCPIFPREGQQVAKAYRTPFLLPVPLSDNGKSQDRFGQQTMDSTSYGVQRR